MKRTAQLQLAIFGPGYGESIVMKVADQLLCQVDSCKPAANYTRESIQDNPDLLPGFFLLTHPHFDHYGSFESIAEIDFAQICRFHGMPADDLHRILKARARRSYNRKHRESARSFSRFNEKWKEIPSDRRLLVSKKTLVWDQELKGAFGSVRFKASALAPSADAVEAFNEGIAAAIESDSAQQTSKQSNDASVVLSVRFGNTRILLTGDIGFDEWNRVKAPKVHLLKLPHHGSKNDNSVQRTREVLVDNDSTVVVTPFMNRLPDRPLLKQIAEEIFDNRANHILLTQKRRRRNEAERHFADVSLDAVSAISMDGDGMIQLTFDADGNRLN